MDCDKYMELLSARLDGALTEEEERELEEHLAVCPDCRAVGAQLSALQGAFPELEEAAAPPEGFARGVMDRIRAEASPKVIPLFKRPQVRALAGLAACLVLVVGLYGGSRYLDRTEKMDMTVRSFNRDAVEEFSDASACEVLTAGEDVPQVAAYAAPETDCAAPEAKFDDGMKQFEGIDVDVVEAPPTEPLSDSAVLVLERMPQGAEELIGSDPEAVEVWYQIPTGECGYIWSGTRGEPEVLAEIERLAQEQGIAVERSADPAEELLYDLVILNP